MIDKYKLNEMLNRIPRERDTEVRIVRSMGDALTFLNYEKTNLRLYDTHLIFYDNGKEYKIMYHNITKISWRPVFQDKNIGEIIDGEYKEE